MSVKGLKVLDESISRGPNEIRGETAAARFGETEPETVDGRSLGEEFGALHELARVGPQGDGFREPEICEHSLDLLMVDGRAQLLGKSSQRKAAKIMGDELLFGL